MMRDPRYQAVMSSLQTHVSRSTWWQFLMQDKVKITPTKLKNGINSGYESYGVYTHLRNCPNKSTKVVEKFTKNFFFDNPL